MRKGTQTRASAQMGRTDGRTAWCSSKLTFLFFEEGYEFKNWQSALYSQLTVL